MPWSVKKSRLSCVSQTTSFMIGVFFAHGRPARARAATALAPELFQRHALDVVADAEREHALFVRDEVLFAEVLGVGLDDLRAARVAVLLLDLQRVFLDQDVDLVRVREQVFEVGDLRLVISSNSV